jgi:hypothetical protein
MEKSSHALVIGELSLFKRLLVSPLTCIDPLTWWQIHEKQFLNVNLLNKYWEFQNHILKLNMCLVLLVC